MATTGAARVAAHPAAGGRPPAGYGADVVESAVRDLVRRLKQELAERTEQQL